MTDSIHHKLDQMLKQGEAIMSILTDVQAQIAQLKSDVQAEGTVVAAAVKAMNGVAAQLQQAISNAQGAGLDANDLAEFQALHTALTQQASDLAAGIATLPGGAPAPNPASAPSPAPAPAAPTT